MYCNECGQELTEEEKFCSNCGKKVTKSNNALKIVLKVLAAIIALAMAFAIGMGIFFGGVKIKEFLSTKINIKNGENEKHYIYTARVIINNTQYQKDINNITISDVKFKEDGTPYVTYKVTQCSKGHSTGSGSWSYGTVEGVGSHSINFTCRYQRLYSSTSCGATTPFTISIIANEVK